MNTSAKMGSYFCAGPKPALRPEPKSERREEEQETTDYTALAAARNPNQNEEKNKDKKPQITQITQIKITKRIHDEGTKDTRRKRGKG